MKEISHSGDPEEVHEIDDIIYNCKFIIMISVSNSSYTSYRIEEVFKYERQCVFEEEECEAQNV